MDDKILLKYFVFELLKWIHLDSLTNTITVLYSAILLLCTKSQGCTVYREVFAPVLFSPLSTSLSVDEFKTTNFNVPSYLFSKVAYLGEFKMGQNRFQVKKGENNMGQK